MKTAAYRKYIAKRYCPCKECTNNAGNPSITFVECKGQDCNRLVTYDPESMMPGWCQNCYAKLAEETP